MNEKCCVLFMCWKAHWTFCRAEQRTPWEHRCVFDHRRLFEVFVVLSTFSMFKNCVGAEWLPFNPNAMSVTYLINRGDDWLLHSAAGAFDLWFWGHVMKEIYIGTELWKDQTLSWTELSWGVASHGPSPSPANILGASGFFLQMLQCSPSDISSLQGGKVHEMAVTQYDHRFLPPKEQLLIALSQHVHIPLVMLTCKTSLLKGSISHCLLTTGNSLISPAADLLSFSLLTHNLVILIIIIHYDLGVLFMHLCLLYKKMKTHFDEIAKRKTTHFTKREIMSLISTISLDYRGYAVEKSNEKPSQCKLCLIKWLCNFKRTIYRAVPSIIFW